MTDTHTSAKFIAFGYYAFRFLRNANINFALTTIFFLHHGVSFSQFMALDTVYFCSKFLFEPINGYLADRYGRRMMLVVSSLSLSAAVSLMVFNPEYKIFIVTQVMTGFAQSIQRGVGSAHIYESLGRIGAEPYYKRIEALGQVATTASMAFATLLGAYLADRSGIDSAWIATAIAMALSVLPIALLGRTSSPTRVIGPAYTFLGAFRDSLKDITQSSDFRKAIAIYSIGFCSTRVGFWMVQQTLIAHGSEPGSAGIWTFAVYLISSVTAWIYGRSFQQGFLGHTAISLTCLGQLMGFGVAYLLAGPLASGAFAVAVALLGVGYGFYQPLAIPLAQEATTNARRATAVSFLSTAASLVYVLVSLLISVLSGHISIGYLLILIPGSLIGMQMVSRALRRPQPNHL